MNEAQLASPVEEPPSNPAQFWMTASLGRAAQMTNNNPSRAAQVQCPRVRCRGRGRGIYLSLRGSAALSLSQIASPHGHVGLRMALEEFTGFLPLPWTLSAILGADVRTPGQRSGAGVVLGVSLCRSAGAEGGTRRVR